MIKKAKNITISNKVEHSCLLALIKEKKMATAWKTKFKDSNQT